MQNVFPTFTKYPILATLPLLLFPVKALTVAIVPNFQKKPIVLMDKTATKCFIVIILNEFVFYERVKISSTFINQRGQLYRFAPDNYVEFA